MYFVWSLTQEADSFSIAGTSPSPQSLSQRQQVAQSIAVPPTPEAQSLALCIKVAHEALAVQVALKVFSLTVSLLLNMNSILALFNHGILISIRIAHNLAMAI